MNNTYFENSINNLTNFYITFLIYLLVFLFVLLIFYIILKLFIEKIQKNGKLEHYKNKFYNSKIVKFINWLKDTGEDDKEDTIKIYSDDNSKNIIAKYKEDKLLFYGRRGLIMLFFYENQNEYKNYHDFNSWLAKKHLKINIKSQLFRQEIESINERFKKESKNIRQIISLSKNFSNIKTKSNFYKYKIILKNN
jgi:hypothetical protein